MTATNVDDKEPILDRVYELAFDYERRYGSCPQCVLAAVKDVLDVGTDDLFKAAHALTAGGALTTKGTCGALAGAMMLVSTRHGRARADFANDSYRECFALSRGVFDAFVEEFGSPICADVQTKMFGRSYDMWDRNEFKAFLTDGGHEDKCTHVVGT
ncbi:MAG: C-GCAxxG-C-C family protein, partial [bacterium]